MLAKFIYTSNTHSNQSFNYLSKINYSQANSTKIQNTITQRKEKKDMITDMKENKRLKSVVAELFMRGRKLSIADFLYHNLVLQCLKVKDKHDTLFYCENK